MHETKRAGLRPRKRRGLARKRTDRTRSCISRSSCAAALRSASSSCRWTAASSLVGGTSESAGPAATAVDAVATTRYSGEYDGLARTESSSASFCTPHPQPAGPVSHLAKRVGGGGGADGPDSCRGPKTFRGARPGRRAAARRLLQAREPPRRRGRSGRSAAPTSRCRPTASAPARETPADSDSAVGPWVSHGDEGRAAVAAAARRERGESEARARRDRSESEARPKRERGESEARARRERASGLQSARRPCRGSLAARTL